MFKVGDKVRILMDGACCAPVKAGDTGVIVLVDAPTGVMSYTVTIADKNLWKFRDEHLELAEDLPLSQYTMEWNIPTQAIKCECGLDSIRSGGNHSSWCPIKA